MMPSGASVDNAWPVRRKHNATHAEIWNSRSTTFCAREEDQFEGEMLV
jgi:hypothetical protein